MRLGLLVNLLIPEHETQKAECVKMLDIQERWGKVFPTAYRLNRKLEASPGASLRCKVLSTLE